MWSKGSKGSKGLQEGVVPVKLELCLQDPLLIVLCNISFRDFEKSNKCYDTIICNCANTVPKRHNIQDGQIFKLSDLILLSGPTGHPKAIR